MAELIVRTALDRYRDSLHGLVPLSADAEHDLAVAYRNGDKRAGEKLIEASLPFVIHIAKEYRRWGVPIEDLIQQGNLGLLKATMKFEPGKHCRLITYAVYWIRAEIRDYVVRGYRIVRLGTTRTERRAMRTFRKGAITSAEELAEQSGMPAARAHKLFPLLGQRDTSLDATTETRGAVIDHMPTETASPEENAIEHDYRQRVRARYRVAVADLSSRERRIVEARMVAENPTTLEELGREFGVSKERVRQIEERVRGKLREMFAGFRETALVH